jgi:hypothetical protein
VYIASPQAWCRYCGDEELSSPRPGDDGEEGLYRKRIRIYVLDLNFYEI